MDSPADEPGPVVGADFALAVQLLRSPSDSFRKRVVTLEPGASLPYDQDQWADAFVVVVQGEICLQALDGSRLRLRAGALLFLARLALHAINNEVDQPAVLVAVTRVPSGQQP